MNHRWTGRKRSELASVGILAALTARQLRFVQGKVAGKSDRRSALDAGYSPSTAANTKAKIMCRPRVKEAFFVLLARTCSEAHLVRRIAEGLDATKQLVFRRDGHVVERREVPDWAERRLYLELVLRLKGLIPKGAPNIGARIELVSAIGEA